MVAVLIDSLGWTGNTSSPSTTTQTRPEVSAGGTITYSVTSPQRTGLHYVSFKSTGKYEYDISTQDGNTLIVGCHFKSIREVFDQYLFSLLDASGTVQCCLRIDAGADFLEVCRGSTTIIGTGTTAIQDSQWYHVEWKIKVTNSIASGECEVILDGTSEINVSATTDTQAAATNAVRRLRLDGANHGQNLSFSQLYVLNTTGSWANDFVGEKARIDILLPSGNGNYSQFTGSDGNSVDNYLLVDNADSDDAAEYVGSSTSGHRDSFTFQDVAITPDSNGILGVQVISQMTKVGGNEGRTVRNFLRHGGTDYDGSERGLSVSTYETFVDLYTEDPSDSSQWTLTDVNALEAGVKVQS